MQIYFIRHGQSVNNALWDSTQSSMGRVQDPQLSEIGQQQAVQLGRYLAHRNPSMGLNGHDPKNLAGFGITHLYSSLMLRAIQTGSLISQSIGVSLAAWIDVHEEGGIYLEDETTGQRQGYPGVTREYLERHFPSMVLPDTLSDTGWWNRPFEEYEDRELRARRFLEELLRRHGGTSDRVAIVSHAGFYNLLVRALLGWPQEVRCWFSLNNAAITRIDFQQDIIFTYMNRSDYLPPHLVT